jgi:hypothetical protein
VLGIVATMSAGLSMIWPLILYWAPARTTTMAPKNSMFNGIPKKLPLMIAVREVALRVKSQKFSTNVP